MSDAIEEYQRKKCTTGNASYQKIAAEFGVNWATLANLEQGKQLLMSAFNISKQKTTPAEETVLIEAIILASRQGIPFTHEHI